MKPQSKSHGKKVNGKPLPQTKRNIKGKTSSVKVNCVQTVNNRSGHSARSMDADENSNTSPCYFCKLFFGTICFLGLLVFCYECLTLNSAILVLITSGLAWFWRTVKSMLTWVFGLSLPSEREQPIEREPPISSQPPEDKSDSGSVISDKDLADAVDASLHTVTGNKAWSFINSIFSK